MLGADSHFDLNDGDIQFGSVHFGLTQSIASIGCISWRAPGRKRA